jgi:molybdopterin converting factor small subunit
LVDFCLDACANDTFQWNAMNIEVLLFARLRELVGHDRVVVQRQGSPFGDVWDGLRAQYPQVEGFGKSLLVSVNHEFAAWDTAVKEGR